MNPITSGPGGLIACCLPILLTAFPLSAQDSHVGEKPPSGIPEGYVLYVTQPNGWGDTRQAAINDLRKRILPWYQKVFGERPGFYIDRDWYALVEVSDGRLWQADGRVGWYVRKARAPAAKPRRTSQSHLSSK